MSKKKVTAKKMFVLYDARAIGGEPEDAEVLSTVGSEAAAFESGRTEWAGYDAIWYEYDVQGSNLVNGKERYDLPPLGGREAI